jgi:hypothetical protein
MTATGQRGQVLIILVGVLFFGGSAAVVGTLATGESVDEAKARIKRTVKDEDRARAAHKVLDEWHEKGKEYFKAAGRNRDEILKLVKRHDATRAQFQALNGEIDTRDAKTLRDFLDFRMSLRKQMTGEEWQAVFGTTRR